MIVFFHAWTSHFLKIQMARCSVGVILPVTPQLQMTISFIFCSAGNTHQNVNKGKSFLYRFVLAFILLPSRVPAVCIPFIPNSEWLMVLRSPKPLNVNEIGKNLVSGWRWNGLQKKEMLSHSSLSRWHYHTFSFVLNSTHNKSLGKNGRRASNDIQFSFHCIIHFYSSSTFFPPSTYKIPSSSLEIIRPDNKIKRMK